MPAEAICAACGDHAGTDKPSSGAGPAPPPPTSTPVVAGTGEVAGTDELGGGGGAAAIGDSQSCNRTKIAISAHCMSDLKDKNRTAPDIPPLSKKCRWHVDERGGDMCTCSFVRPK